MREVTGSISADLNMESSSANCVHCGTPSPLGDFCCSGCEAVYQLLHDCELDRFYELRSVRDRELAAPALQKVPTYLYLDDAGFQNDFVVDHGEGLKRVDFLVAGIHCSACVWLLENLPKVCPAVVSARIEFQKRRLEIVYSSSAKLSEIAQQICRLGYEPRPYQEGERSALFEQESRALLYRLGVAAVSAGNCMMIAISLYQGIFSGIEERYAAFFVWVSAILALPAVTFSSWQFYRSALGGLRGGFLHIDLPISIGIILGYTLSIVSAIRGETAVYFDSITMLVFLMLIGRYLQHRALATAIEKQDQVCALLPQSTTRVTNKGVEEEVFIGSLSVGELVRIKSGEVVPADGELVSQSAKIDMSVFSGESLPIVKSLGDGVFASARNLGDAFDLRILKAPDDSRVSAFLSRTIVNKSAATEALLDRISRSFVFTVLTLGVLAFGYWSVAVDVSTALEVLLAFFVVSCPCALGLSAPMLGAKALSEASKRGILVSNQNAFERSYDSKQVYVDKTGTLTERSGESSKVFSKLVAGGWDRDAELPIDAARALYALESGSNHPISSAIRELLSSRGVEALAVQRSQQNGISGITKEGIRAGVGNQAFIEEHFLDLRDEIQRVSASNESPVYFVFGNELWSLSLREQIAPGAKQVIRELHDAGKEVIILSGDTKHAVDSIGKQLNIEKAYSELSPEEKRIFIEREAGSSIMVGDGGNDAAALSTAGLGVGISGGVEQVMKVADVYISTGRFSDFGVFFRAAIRLMRLYWLCFSFALLYNIVAGGIALFGYMNPLVAALLMPISSLSVIAFAISMNPFESEVQSSQGAL